MSDFPTNGGLRGRGREFAEALQRIRDQEKRELDEDRALDLARLTKVVERFGERNAFYRMNRDLSVSP